MNYDNNDKLDMVLEVLRSPEKAKEIAKRRHIGIATLYKWRKRFLEGGQQELLSYTPGPKLSLVTQAEREKDEKLKKYEAQIALLAAELEIVKKNENGPTEAFN